MYEVEVKVAAEHDAVGAALPADAEPLGAVEQVDTYFDAPHRDFAESDEALRLRREREITAVGDGTDHASGDEADVDASADGAGPGGSTVDGAVSGWSTADGGSDASTSDCNEWTTELTYKGPLVEVESKTREEFESVVTDGEAVHELFERLGFEPAATVRKGRERYRVDGFTVTLDAVGGLGEFVEVETEREREADVAAARDEARSLLADLGCDPDDQLRTSYLGLLLAEE